MAYGNPDSVHMDDDLYSDEESDHDMKDHVEPHTEIVSTKLLGGNVKEGDEIVVQVVKTYGDEAEIRYAPKKGSEDHMDEDKELEALSA